MGGIYLDVTNIAEPVASAINDNMSSAAPAYPVSETSIKGRQTIHMVWRVPAADEKAVDAYWLGHQEWMRKSHVMGLEGDDKVAPRLTSFSINKGKELNNPLDPASGETGNFLYVMSETYAAPEGIGSHMEKGTADWPGMKEIGSMSEKYGVFMEAGACSVFTSLGDKAEVDITAAGQPTIHMVWRVPAADEKAVDAYWLGHQEWMRKSHVMGLEGDDKVAPRLTSFSINKGKELNNPLDPASGETGNFLYVMSETYAAPEGIGSHMEKGTADWPGMKEIGSMSEKYGVFMEAGACSVFTNLGEKMAK